MAEYWKSIPRKFCDICKCWFADNKASIGFHERGKRHQENAQKRIQEIQKRGLKEYKKQQQLENDMEKIEKAALAAYEKDLRNMGGEDKSLPNVQPTKKIPYSVPEPSAKQPTKKVQKKPKVSVKSKEPEAETTPQKIWYEGMSEDGYKYYWNSVTSESSWEAPEEGFISIEEQSQSVNSETTSEEQQCASVEDTETQNEDNKTDTESSNDSVSCSIGPQPKVDPYGQWVPIEKEEPIEYDLQLPVSSENTVEVFIPIHKEESLKFKEKVIGQLSETGPSEVTFKKRKNLSSLKKNSRQRTTDDD